MNKKYIFSILALCASLNSFAQLSGNGYYRIKNKATNNYVSLVSDELNYDNALLYIGLQNLIKDTNARVLSLWGYTIPLSGGTAYYLTDSKTNGAFGTLVEKMNVYMQNDVNPNTDNASPATVFYIQSQNSNSYDLCAQGTSLYKISTGSFSSSLGNIPIGGFYTSIKESDNNYALYLPIAVSYNKYTFTAGNYYFTDKGHFEIERDAASKSEAQWYIEPATTFAVKPLAKVKDAAGHYYTTLCVDFPFSIPATGSTVLAAYTVTGKDAEGNAVLNKLSGTIPGGTPVILECTSADESTNILNIESTAPAGKSCATGAMISSDVNYLKGRYFNAPAATYQYKNYLNQVSNPQTANFNTTGNVLKNDQSKYRVLNAVNGVVGFYKLKNANTTMGANKAFLDISSLPTVNEISAKTFAVENMGEVTGIENVEAVHQKASVIYDLQGRRVTHPQHGLYIVNGKKVLF